MDQIPRWRQVLDIPPVWLAAFLAVGWLQADRLPVLQGDFAVIQLLAGILTGGGVILALLAVTEMRRYKTTLIPHRQPQTLVQSGIFRRSRNPIYLGDLLILTGMLLYWQAWPALLLVPVFAAVITDRFIGPEEERLRDRFGRAFEDYTRRTRRWI